MLDQILVSQANASLAERALCEGVDHLILEAEFNTVYVLHIDISGKVVLDTTLCTLSESGKV